MDELTYEGETYRRITRNGMYYATADGKVLSLHRGKQTLLMPYQRIECKQKVEGTIQQDCNHPRPRRASG